MSSSNASHRKKDYAYVNNMNLVLQADRSRTRRRGEGTGEVESLVGNLAGRMGDRVRRSIEALEAKKRKLADRKAKTKKGEDEDIMIFESGSSRKRRRGNGAAEGAYSTVLSSTADLDNLSYLPKTKLTREAYEEMLSVVQKILGDVPRDILRGAVDETLAILKNVDLKASERQRNIEELLMMNRGLTTNEISRIVAIGKRITDYTSNSGVASSKEDENGDIDDAFGVAVVFDDDDEDEEDGLVGEVREIESDDDDDDNYANNSGTGVVLAGGEEEAKEEEDEGNLDPREIDAHWLQRELGKFYSDANQTQKMSGDVLGALKNGDERAVENNLVMLLEYDKFDFIKMLLRNRAKILYCTRLHQVQSEEEKRSIESEMLADPSGEGANILAALKRQDTASNWAERRAQSFVKRSRREAKKLSSRTAAEESEDNMATLVADGKRSERTVAQRVLDLEKIAFKQGSRLMTNKRCELPAKAWRAQKKGYEEVHVPPKKRPPPADGEKLRLVSTMPKWAQKAFTVSKMKSLNRVQSALYEKAFKSSENLLLCAPTGAGKTNVAVLTMLQAMSAYLLPDGKIDKSKFKIVYVAPMKALVQECVANFSKRLGVYDINVRELSGDVQLSRAQIADTQVIVTTPEKWDIVTRKSGDRTYTQLVRLLIIDEIHLLHDSRGAVLESVIARTIRQVETTREHVRIVGLSATLPNYHDVAIFCRVDIDTGLFYFDNSYRPVPLQQQYVGVTEKKPMKRLQLMNQIAYDKSSDFVKGQHQVIIFVHSRKDTAKTARAIRDMATEKDESDVFTSNDPAIREILRTESETVMNPDLKELLPFGFGIHHAGMNRSDRSLVEDLFADGSIRVLCSTATLAWGVNLPAHTVIIKGTQVYSPEKGSWVELSYLDIMQMFGRAGRPQYDSQGEGIMITTHSELQYYLSLMNQQLPIESQFVARLPDSLNAEIVMGTVQNTEEAVRWLSYTYLYVRMLRNPGLYGIKPGELERDPQLKQRRVDLVHSAASLLAKHGLVRYDRKSGALQATPLGRVASHYYIVYHSVATFNEFLKPSMSEVELFRLFSLSYEFRNIVVRQEEKLELKKLLEQVPIPVKESIEEPSAKVNVLLQAYISQLKLDGFALTSDMVYVQQSAGRIMRALFEIALCRRWAGMAEKTLNMCKMIDRRMWLSHTPLRQFTGLSSGILRKIERKAISWDRYYDLKPQDLGELLRMPSKGKKVYRYIHLFPRLELSARVQPITRSTLKVDLCIAPDFQMDPKVHNWGEAFHVMVQDVDGEKLLHHEMFLLPCHLVEEEHTISFMVPIFEPLPPQYFVKVVSDRWLHAKSVLPVSFRHLLLPDKFPPHTELLDLQPLPVTALRDPVYQVLYAKQSTHFNPVQTQVFPALYESDKNVLVAAPDGSGKIVAAEFALLRMLRQRPDGRCVFIAPNDDLAAIRFREWSLKFGVALEKSVVKLTGDSATDVKLLKRGQIVVATPDQWDVVSRRWKFRPDVRNVALFVVSHLHLVGGQNGPTLEVVVSRMRYIASQTKNGLRIVGLSASIANAATLGDWIGARSSGQLFSFHPQVRPLPLEVRIQGFPASAFGSRMLAMSKPVYNSVLLHAAGEQAIVFVPSRRQSQLTALDLIAYASGEETADFFVRSRDQVRNVCARLSKAETLKHTLSSGVGFLHTGMSEAERKVVMTLYRSKAIGVVVVQRDLCWAMGGCVAKLVTVMGTCSYDGREHRYVDYPIAQLLHMMGLSTANSVILCHTPKKAFYKKFLNNPLPVESHLSHCIHDTMNAEIATRVLENKQDAVDYMTWTLYYRRLTQNPNYYNMAGRMHQHVSDHLSELIEETLEELEQSKCVSCEDEYALSPLNLGMIAAYYHVRYTSIEIFATSVSARTKIRGLIKILAAASEFDDLPVRSDRDVALENLIRHLPNKVDNSEKQARKANALLQAHFSRVPVSTDMRTDQRIIVGRAVQLLSAIVDVISSNGWLKPALAAMELIQMVVQARWAWDSPLLQVPHFTRDIIDRCEAHNKSIRDTRSKTRSNDEDEDDDDEEEEGTVENVFDILDLDDDVRESLLQLPASKMSDVARFCNAYPNIEMDFEVIDARGATTGRPVEVEVRLSRDEDDIDDPAQIGKVVAPSYPKRKTEGWWLVIGDVKSNKVMSIKKLSVQERANAKLSFAAPKIPGDYTFKLYLVCDSYLRCDQEYDFEISVAQGEDDSSSGSSGSEDDGSSEEE